MRNRLGRIGNIAGHARRRLIETEAAVGADIDRRQRRRTALLAGERPGREAIPVIFAGVVNGGGGKVGGRAVLQILIDEWQPHVLEELRRGHALPFERAARAELGRASWRERWAQ